FFLSQVKAELSKALDVIHQRQQQLLKEPNKEFGFYCVVIDEALAITAGLPKRDRDDYLSQLDSLALLGRSCGVVLAVTGQALSASGNAVAISTQARDQLGLKILLVGNANVTAQDCRFLFANLVDPNSVVITRDNFSKGLGLVYREADGRVMPLLAPYIENLEG
ncbi:hypothetical protein LMB72_01465, partial [Limosilactobacillus reuteri]|nr:hypothetical protein [Limosilactobacillus reuteri]